MLSSVRACVLAVPIRPADLTAKGQADALTDLIGFQLAAADAGVKGIALRAAASRRNARPPVAAANRRVMIEKEFSSC